MLKEVISVLNTLKDGEDFCRWNFSNCKEGFLVKILIDVKVRR